MSAISGLNSPASGISFSGLGSGIDTQQLIQGLLAVQKARVTQLQGQQQSISTVQSAFDTIRTALTDLQTRSGTLASIASGPFAGRSATVSDDTILHAAAGTSATPGSYSLTVKSLAAAHEIVSQGLSDPNALLQTGTLQLRVGSGSTTTITVNSSNNTLQGLAATINASGGDVQAAVINDGTANPYRLLLTSRKTGQANQVQVTNNLNQGTGATLNLDPSTQTIQSGADAQVVLGSGAGALTISSASNTVDSVIPGVTLNLLQANPNQAINVSVGNDVAGATRAINDFVGSFNQVIDFVNSRSRFDTTTQTGGVLLGNIDARNLEDALTATVGAVVAGLSQQANRLSAIGVTFDDNGKLQVDAGKLGQALSGQASGVSFADIGRLFTLSGTSTSSGVAFLVGGTQTLAGTVGVKVTQAAAAASLTAAGPIAAGGHIDSTNNQLSLSINGRSLDIQLTQGDYTASGLAQELQGQINAAVGATGGQVSVSSDGSDVLTIKTLAVGSAAGITISGGSALAALGFTAGQHAAGQDVAGHFIVNGVSEAATGVGQLLIGKSGNAHTDGLNVQVTLTQAQLVADPNLPEAQLTITTGLAAQLNRVLNAYLDPVKGQLKTINDGLQSQIDNLQQSITRQNTLIGQQQDALVQRFAAMEAAVSQLRSLSNTLASQLVGLSGVSFSSGSSSRSSGSTSNSP